MKPETKRLVDAAMESAHRDGVAAARGNAYFLRSPARRELDEHLEEIDAARVLPCRASSPQVREDGTICTQDNPCDCCALGAA